MQKPNNRYGKPFHLSKILLFDSRSLTEFKPCFLLRLPWGYKIYFSRVWVNKKMEGKRKGSLLLALCYFSTGKKGFWGCLDNGFYFYASTIKPFWSIGHF